MHGTPPRQHHCHPGLASASCSTTNWGFNSFLVYQEALSREWSPLLLVSLVASVHAQIRRTTTYLESRYVDYGDDFGGGLSARLASFIRKHGPDGGSPNVTVQGVDSDSRPTTHEYILHENHSEDFQTVGGHDSCINLCTAFAKTLVRNLNKRFEDLQSLSGVKLFTLDEWPLGRVERNNQCLEWLMSRVTLPHLVAFKRPPRAPFSHAQEAPHGPVLPRPASPRARFAARQNCLQATHAQATHACAATGPRARGQYIQQLHAAAHASFALSCQQQRQRKRPQPPAASALLVPSAASSSSTASACSHQKKQDS
ncbi:unnamed protein product [Closterium sp. NIES-54]